MQIKVSSATRDLPFFMVLTSDHLTGATGLAPTVTIRKNGGAFGSPAGAVSEIANGWYRIAPNATDSNTVGPLLLHATAATADPTDALFEVVGWDPDAGTVVTVTGNVNGSVGSVTGGVTVTTNNDKTGYSLVANAVDAAQFTQAAADKVWTSASRTLTAFAQGFSDQVWASATRTLTAFSQAFSDQVWTSATRTLTAFSQTFSDQVWTSATRTLTSFGTLASDTATAVWSAGSRTLTAFSQAFSDQTWASVTRTLTGFSQTFSDQVWASASRTLTSFGTLVADTAAAVWSAPTRTLTSIASLGADVWTYPIRTLTQTAAAVVATFSGTDLIWLRGDTIAQGVSGLGSLTGRSRLWFTIKHDNADADSASIVQIVEGTGLIVLNGAVATAGNGSIVVTDATTGALTVNLAAVASAQLVPDLACRYDLQVLVGSTVTTLMTGKFTVQSDQTRSTS